MLSATSPRCAAVPGAALKLMAHQEAMVAKCIDIENTVMSRLKTSLMYTSLGDEESERDIIKCGILDAPVGSGKTFVLLSLCLLKPRDVIVVPSHLYHQWVAAIDKFVENGALRVLKIEEYGDTAQLQFVNGKDFWKQYDVVLMSSLHFAPAISSLVYQDVVFTRIIIDEVDSIESMVTSPVRVPMKKTFLENVFGMGTHKKQHKRTVPLINALQKYTDIIWLVSSSVSNLYSADGLHLGKIHIPKQVVSSYHVSCEPKFIANNMQLPKIIEETRVLPEGILSKVLANLVSGKTLKALYAEDRKTIVRELMYDRSEGLMCPVTNFELAKILYKGYRDRKRELMEMLKTHSINNDEFRSADDLDLLESQTSVCINQLSCFTQGWNEVSAFTELTKVQVCVDLARENPKGKLLFFSEFPRVLDYLADEFRAAKITYVDLAHSTMFSCGMNLENTTHIILMHELPAKLREQVIGRGQRPGRTSPLTVVQLLYPGEHEALAKESNVNIGLDKKYEWHEQEEKDQHPGSTLLNDNTSNYDIYIL